MATRAADLIRAVPFERLLPTLMLIWLIGVATLSVRPLTGWLWIQRLRTHGVSAADEGCAADEDVPGEDAPTGNAALELRHLVAIAPLVVAQSPQSGAARVGSRPT